MLPGMPRNGCTTAFAAVFLTLWCTATFGADAAVGWAVARQCWTYTFATTTGTITRSDLTEGRDADGDRTYHLEVAYDFTANGRQFTGDRYRYLSMGTNDGSWRRVRDELPVGSAVPVYYDPADPTDAVLVRGPQGADLFVLWFLAPFNVVAVGGLRFALRSGRPAFVPTDPRVIARTDAGWQFRPLGRDGWVVFAGVLMAVTFAGVFLIGLTLGFNPPLAVMVVAWLFALGLATAAARRYARRPVLAVDETLDEVTLYQWGRPVQTVPRAAVTGVSVEEVTTTDSEGDRTTLHYLVLRWGEKPQRRTARFHSCSTPETAAAVAAWLADALRPGSGSPG